MASPSAYSALLIRGDDPCLGRVSSMSSGRFSKYFIKSPSRQRFSNFPNFPSALVSNARSIARRPSFPDISFVFHAGDFARNNLRPHRIKGDAVAAVGEIKSRGPRKGHGSKLRGRMRWQFRMQSGVNATVTEADLSSIKANDKSTRAPGGSILFLCLTPLMARNS